MPKRKHERYATTVNVTKKVKARGKGINFVNCSEPSSFVPHPGQSFSTIGSGREQNDNPQFVQLDQGMGQRYNEDTNLENFVIIEPKSGTSNPLVILNRSADLNRMPVKYEHENKCGSKRCVLKINDQVLADVTVKTTKLGPARNAAAAQALEKLRKFCRIILVKENDTQPRISKKDIVDEDDDNAKSDIIASDNVGYKLLQKMGWVGGGVGKYGSGIAEPVSVNSVLRREGLGSDVNTIASKEFRKGMKAVLENYAVTGNQEDLVFSNDFSEAERVIIHTMCTRLKLHHKSKGRGDDRYITVSRKRSLSELMDFILSAGGETFTYQLVPAGSYVPPPPREMAEEMTESDGQQEISEETISGSNGQQQDVAGETTQCQPVLPESSAVKREYHREKSQTVTGAGSGCSICCEAQHLIKELESRCAALEKRTSELKKKNRDLKAKQAGRNDTIQHNSDPPPEDSKNIEDNGVKLRPVLAMAKYYSKLKNKESLDPYATLQKCAAKAKQKVKCVTKACESSVGRKTISCEIFANEILLVSISLTGGTNPDEAKRKLAIAVLEKIAQPHLQLVENGEDGLKLEGSSTFIADVDPPPEDSKNIEDNNVKLRHVLAMAKYYSKLKNKESLDPYAMLQKCAAKAKQKVKCVTKACESSVGRKTISCEIFANEILLVSISLTGGTNPDEAKRKLAIAVLEKIAQPHLQLVENGEDGLKLEGSSTFIADVLPASSTDIDMDDINALRDEFESKTEWKLRSQFLEANKNSLPVDRLVCLSRCFVNMAVYCCSYPPSVMQEVRDRSNGALDEIERIRQDAD